MCGAQLVLFSWHVCGCNQTSRVVLSDIKFRMVFNVCLLMKMGKTLGVGKTRAGSQAGAIAAPVAVLEP